ncbi:hypothetical protein F5X68DRAFT_249172 [Plectosphaerella plurivora]|uniref:LysM domain-containing protein n=1 Tax=Plectosphaerella plurivora TaxID=936078 RepID=A0A9P9A6E0_9PEZI|nr:hypothetical protein F5X68DRAFT_249172 [Plectosphaerella plurivora]
MSNEQKEAPDDLLTTSRLTWDDYPLEIQCNRCFWKTFSIGHQSLWTHMIWDEWTEQTWANMVRNCNIPSEDAAITPLVNSSAYLPDDGQYFNRTMWAFKHGLASACLDKWNPNIHAGHGPSFGVRNTPQNFIHFWKEGKEKQKMCIPRPCEIAVVGFHRHINTVEEFVDKMLDNVTMRQFLRWNPCLDRNSWIQHRDTVCIGPPGTGGRFVAEVGTPAKPSKWTVAAIPPSTAADKTVARCGKYHVAKVDETCAHLSIKYEITVEKLKEMNRSVKSSLSLLEPGLSYCVARFEEPNIYQSAEEIDWLVNPTEYYRKDLWMYDSY